MTNTTAKIITCNNYCFTKIQITTSDKNKKQDYLILKPINKETEPTKLTKQEFNNFYQIGHISETINVLLKWLGTTPSEFYDKFAVNPEPTFLVYPLGANINPNLNYYKINNQISIDSFTNEERETNPALKFTQAEIENLV